MMEDWAWLAFIAALMGLTLLGMFAYEMGGIGGLVGTAITLIILGYGWWLDESGGRS
jgi:hypothetical protein